MLEVLVVLLDVYSSLSLIITEVVVLRHPELVEGSSIIKVMPKDCRDFYVYILASKRNGTIYIGVTNNLERRLYEHKNDLIEGFTRKYRIHTLVYYEQSDSVESGIAREKQLKGWNRKKKLRLIEGFNPGWLDLDPSTSSG